MIGRILESLHRVVARLRDKRRHEWQEACEAGFATRKHVEFQIMLCELHYPPVGRSAPQVFPERPRCRDSGLPDESAFPFPMTAVARDVQFPEGESVMRLRRVEAAMIQLRRPDTRV